MNLTTKLILLLAAGIVLLAGAVLSVWKVQTIRRRVSDAKAERQRLKELRRKDKPALPDTNTPPALRYFAVAAILCGLVSVGALGYGGYLVYIHAAPPSDYVATGIFIEESGYQDERFTADGVVYEALPLECDYYVCMEKKTAVFSYKPDGFLNGYLSGNYFAIENSHGFDIVWNGQDRLFAPADQAAAIVEFYRADPDAWYLLDYEQEDENGDPVKVRLFDEAVTAIRAYSELDVAKLETATAIAEDGYDTVEVWAQSGDGIVILNEWFVVIKGKAYVYMKSTTTEQDQEKMTLAILPDEISAPLAGLVEGTDQ
ncbi:MAG: hypothetical protein IJX76_07405 [Clostridia bacterium]|nr:hypothetical protein [Clostridia bacterium]